MPLMEQMANIGSEVGRARKRLGKDKPQLAVVAFCRALELWHCKPFGLRKLFNPHGPQGGKTLLCNGFKNKSILKNLQ